AAGASSHARAMALAPWGRRLKGLRAAPTLPAVASTRRGQGGSMKDCRVLVVEDDRDLREVIAEILEAEGFPVERAANGHEALEKLRGGYEADVILTNLLMPVVDGYELRAELKKHPGWSRIPLIVL